MLWLVPFGLLMDGFVFANMNLRLIKSVTFQIKFSRQRKLWFVDLLLECPYFAMNVMRKDKSSARYPACAARTWYNIQTLSRFCRLQSDSGHATGTRTLWSFSPMLLSIIQRRLVREQRLRAAQLAFTGEA